LNKYFKNWHVQTSGVKKQEKRMCTAHPSSRGGEFAKSGVSVLTSSKTNSAISKK